MPVAQEDERGHQRAKDDDKYSRGIDGISDRCEMVGKGERRKRWSCHLLHSGPLGAAIPIAHAAAVAVVLAPAA